MRVHEEHDGVHLREVVLPDLACDFVPAQVEGAELDFRNGKFLRGWMLCGIMLGQALILQHVQQCGLPRIVQPKEKDLRVLLASPSELRMEKNQSTMNIAGSLPALLGESY
eukprot:CAMPEP_0205876282 /NCGR_PEP_ID=MMETSP1083-20121108/13709_1 /ASSEMBLY_ACC=CAM_ASM_000430 /TAXON_ID=97485 /ORGANISM="Prymnesium parvum, Strain Texoma1" /LENGTH=110 /DNA_ID=CAMNT_0053239021 /DNA_START=573 /DNA_END=903 /DNA_ORIENTATION=-